MKKTTLRQAAMKLALVAFALLAPLGLRAQSPLTIGTGETFAATGSSGNAQGSALGNPYNYYSTAQFIYTADELVDMQALAAPNGSVQINSVSFYHNANSFGGTVNIYLAHTDASTVDASSPATTGTLVYTGTDITLGSGSAEWQTFVFDEPFVYNGQDNLLIIVSRSKRSSGSPSYSSSQSWQYSTTTNNMFMQRSSDSQGYEVLTNTTYSYTASTNRPNIQIAYQTPVATPKPTGFAVSNILHNQADLSWTENGTATSWQICVNDDEENLITATTNPYPLTGLTPLTAYTVKVRSVGSPNSDWSSSRSFNTTAQAEAVGDSWSDDFEGGSCGWELINGTLTNNWVWGTAVNNGGTHALYVSNDGGTSNTYTGTNTKIFATKLLNFTEGKYTFSYDWRCKGESTYDFLRVALVPASQTLTAGTDYSTITQPTLPSGWIALDGGKLNLQEAWQNKEVTINVTSGNYYLVLAWRCETGAYDPAAAVDNVSITRVACPYDVADLAVANDPAVTQTTATITWTAGEASQWQVATKTGDADWSTLPTIYNTNSAALTGLTAATTYQVKARAYCNASDQGSWCDPIQLTTACPEYAEVPFTENFDGYTITSVYTPSSRTLPTCWSFINTSTYSTNKWYPTMHYYSYTDYSNSSPNYIRFYIDAYSGSNYDPQDQYLILPAVQDVDGLRIKLQARVYSTGSTYDATFKVGIMSDPADAGTFEEIAEKTPTTESYEQYIIPFNGYTGSGNHIAIKVEAPETPAASYTHAYRAVCIDDITVEEIPSCVEPSDLQFVSSTTNSADIQWTAVGTEASWDIYYSTENVAPTTQTGTNTSDNPATISGLTAATTYYVWVRAHCDDGDGQQSPWIGGISFATQCDAISTFPWSETFESFAANTVPLCWDNSATTGSDYGSHPEYYWGVYEYSGNKMIRMYNWNAHGPLAIINTPTVDLPAEPKELTFFYTHNATSGDFTVKISEDNGVSFVDLHSYSKGDGSSYSDPGTFTEATISLADYINKSVIIQFYSAANYGSGAIFIDNIRIDNIPTCKKPSNLTVDNSATTAHTATLSWTKGSNDQDAWQIAYSTSNSFAPAANFTPGEGEGLVDADNNTSFEVTGLAQSTTYYAYVRADCGGGDYSAWNNTKVTFTTLAGNVTPTGLAKDNASITSSQAKMTWNAVAGNTRHEYYELYYSGLNTMDPNNLDLDSLISNITTTYHTFTGLTAEKTYYVWVRDYCGTDGYSNWSSSANFTTAASCQTPDGLAASNVTTNSATISWNTYGQSGFNLRYSTDGENWTPVNGINTPYTLDGVLTSNTAYQVQVQATCGNETWSTPVLNFTTKCDARDDFPISYGFETSEGFPSNASTPTTNQLGNCWRNEATLQNGSYATRVWGTSTSYKHDGSQALILPDKGNSTNFAKTMLAFPAMNFTSANGYTVSFWINRSATSSNPEGFKVYASHTDTIDVNAVELGHYSRNYNIAYPQIEAASGWYQYEINIPQATMTGTVYLIFEGQSYYGNATYVDDIIIDEAPSCSKPSGLTFESATTTTATLSWTAGGSEPSWDIYYSTENVAPTTQTGTNTTANPATIEGLTASTTYYVWVRAHCTNEDQSDWFGGIEFATQCETTVVDADHPFFEGFENATFPPTCWSIGENANSSYNWTRSTSASYVPTGSGCASSGYYGPIYLYTPTLYIDATKASLSFSSYNAYTEDYDKNSVLISVDGGVNWTELWSPATVAQSFVTTTIDLTAYVGQDIKLCFKYEGSNAHGWYLDDVNLFIPTVIEKAIEANKWYAIATPVNNSELGQETLEGITNLTSGTYDLYGYTENTGTWTKATTALTTGKGYIYRRSTAATLSFVGVPNTGDRLVTITNSCPDGNIAGLNLVGNPFPHAISRTDYYTLQPNGLWLAHDAGNIGEAEAFLVYTSLNSTDYEINDVTPSKKSAPAASPAITFTVSNGEFRDVAYARFDGSAVLPKIGHLEPSAPALSIPVNGKKYAIADLGNGCESFEMTFSGIGDYTISASGDATYLHLIDKVTGSDIDLLSQPYTFKAGIGDITSRFIVKLVPDGETVSAGNFAFRNGNGWTIEGDGTLEAYDALGRRIFAQEISSSNYQLSKASFPAAGVYVLRMGGNSQKIVVTE